MRSLQQECSAADRIRPRRVLMTADAVGGVWRYSLDLSRALIDRGTHTMLAVMGPLPTAAQRREAARAGVPIVANPYRLEWMDDAQADVARAGEWLLMLERALRPDLIHLNGYAHAALPWSAPVVVVAHSCVRSWWRAVKGEPAPRQYDGYSASVAAGLRAAAAVVAPSGAMLATLADEYGPVPGHVIPNGFAAAPRGTPPWHLKEPLVLSAGRAWDEAKNIQQLCAVAPDLPWPVYVAGDTCRPDGADCQLHGVRALGRLSAREVRGWYRRAAVYAAPVRYEPFGLAILEAARAGCALVLGDLASLRENWSGAACFVAPDDRQALAAAIQSLIDQPELRADLARRAFARSSVFTIGRTVDEYLRIYDSVSA